jgi:hypothetical protein
MVAADHMGVLAEVGMEASAGARTPVRAGARMEARAGLAEDIAEAKLNLTPAERRSIRAAFPFAVGAFVQK